MGSDRYGGTRIDYYQEVWPLEDRKCQLSMPWLHCGILLVGWCIQLEGGIRLDLSQPACRQVEIGKWPSATPPTLWDVDCEILTGIFSLSLMVFLSLEDGNK